MAITVVTCPLPGTFYRRSAPDQPVLKREGEAVSVGDTLGLVEVMKSFTPVTAEVAGQLVRFLIEDEDALMPGQPLAEIEG